MVLAIYIGDGLVAATHESDILNLLDYLKTEFDIKVLDATYFLGLQIHRYKNGSLHVSLETYARKVLEKFNMIDANPLSTPAETSLYSIDEEN